MALFELFCGVACTRRTGAGRRADVVTREGTFRVINPETKTAEITLAPITGSLPRAESLRLRYIVRRTTGKLVYQVRIDNQVVVLVQRFDIGHSAVIRRLRCHGEPIDYASRCQYSCHGSS